ncbi:MAG: polyhydroxyalkanoate depolymerase [Burkholderiaceae bacterium]|nr:polyhydroxyalkanoate depolymerase [Burkholderiaceae bacterium]
MLYSTYQALQDSLGPWQRAAGWGGQWLDAGQAWLEALDPGLSQPPLWRGLAAASEVFARLQLTHQRPGFGIDQVLADGRPVPVHERVVQRLAFGSLLHFQREDLADASREPLPRVLIVAPLSGHFATLLADTARTMLEDHDVYITDWHNARMVPLDQGRFGLADYVGHLIGFLEHLGPHTHVLAVCQPCPSVLAAAALMAQRNHVAQPRSITLMAGPVDCRVNPTEVNRLATGRPIEWFERNLVHRVPLRYPGARRRVYPGFLQLGAFMSMNPDRHRQAFVDLYRQRLGGEHGAADATARFYEEYFAVNDLPAEFYLETVEQVFQRHALALGELVLDGERVEPAAIRRCALFTVEGERDDICSIGQTVAAHELTPGIKPHLKQHHVQPGVGHYGVFSGRRWRQQIYPRVREMIHMLH